MGLGGPASGLAAARLSGTGAAVPGATAKGESGVQARACFVFNVTAF